MPRPKLVPVAAEEVRLGSALPYPLLDAQGTLLLAPGDVLHNVQQVSALRAIGLYTLAAWQAKAVPIPGAATITCEDLVDEHRVADFAALQLPPGKLLYLRQADQPSQRLMPARLCEWQAETGLLLQFMAEEMSAWPPSQCVPVEVRLLADKHHVVSFHTVMTSSGPIASAQRRLAYPAQIAVRRLRRSLRVSVNFPVRISSTDTGHWFDGCLVNLGTEGCQVEMSQWMADIGDELVLDFALKEAGAGSLPQVVQGTVRNLQLQGGDMPLVQLGLQFVGLEEAGRLEIECFIFQVLGES